MMQTIKNLPLRSKVLLIVLGAAVVGCLAMMTVTPARSALVFQSEEYEAEIQQTHIGVVLTENDQVVSGDGALIADPKALLGDDDSLKLGKEYAERLSVKNASDDMDEYVRLTVRKYWAATPENASDTSDDATAAPVKTASLNPAYIVLTYDADSQGDWVFSAEESNDERLVFYYKHLLKAGEAAATPAVTAIGVDPALKNAAESYAHCWLGLAAQVDSVQVNNAPAAAKSAWGVDTEALGLDWTHEG